ncbi:MAG: ATP-binding protein [Synergistaceae bacterium]|jgi:energy-coupling factor transporter ATP-binding protein EcfA2|nr:ATP-binding protein [Synergistaceae bacterium]
MREKCQSPSSQSFFKIHVEDFGKIAKADIELSPLTLFIGDNNSGKSYLLTLIYGLLSKPFFDLFRQNKDFISKRFIPMIEDGLSGKTERYRFSPDDFGLLERTVNDILERDKKIFIERIFNKKIPIGKLAVEFCPPFPEIDLCFDAVANDGEMSYLRLETRPKKCCYSRLINTSRFMDGIDRKSLVALMVSAIIRTLLAMDRPAYLPASRTGFLLAFKSLVGGSIEKAFGIAGAVNAAGNADKLTVPVIDFLKMLAAFSTDEESRHIDYRARTAEFVENKILDGKIIVTKTPVPDYMYLPLGFSESLPMFVSSGVVTETLPLWLVLNKPGINCLMIEEPETGLHPALQKEIARALAKIANLHFPVIASTHSDIILQHVNNMTRLKKRPDREQVMSKLEYGEDDRLGSERVAVYQFDASDGGTTVTKIEYDEERGFAAPTFIDALGGILDETMDIESEEFSG